MGLSQLTLATLFSSLKPVEQHGTKDRQSSKNPHNLHPDNNLSIYRQYRHITIKEIDRRVNFAISGIRVTESHRHCCVFCLQNMGESLPIGKTHAKLKAQYGKDMKKAYIQESKKILADNGFMKATACSRTKGIQYIWYAANELEQQIQSVREGIAINQDASKEYKIIIKKLVTQTPSTTDSNSDQYDPKLLWF
jgi:hypothetical protein